MENTSWTLLRGDFKNISDIDAALSNVSVDSSDDTLSCVARVHHDFYTTLTQTAFWDGADVDIDLKSLKERLKGGRLAILPRLPPLHALVEDPLLSKKILANVLMLASRNPGTLFSHPTPEELHEIRESELATIVRSHQQLAVLSVGEGHFELPSGAHTSHFVRLAECLSNADDLERIVYWIAQDIVKRYDDPNNLASLLVLVDNPSTLIIALRLAQVFPRAKVKYDCVRAYPETSDGVYELEQWLKQRVVGCTEIYCIVSVSSTGGLTTSLKRAAKTLDVDIRSAVLYGTTAGLQEAPYCNLDIPDYWHVEAANSCGECRKQQAVFRIDKARYFLTQRNVTSVALPAPLFEQQRGFVEAYGKHDGVLRTHVNDLSWIAGKHRAFSIDVSALLTIPEFQNEVEDRIHKLAKRPDLVVVPTHPGARLLGQFLSEKLGLRVYYHPTLRLDTAKEGDRVLADALSNSDALLIVDDIAYSSERIQSYVKAIRESGKIFRAPANITLFPLLVVPSTDSQFTTAIRGIESDHDGKSLKVKFLYRFPLPDWDVTACPWCFESKKLRSLSDAFGADENDETDARGTLLDDIETGVCAENWISKPAETSAPVFGNDSPLLASQASSIQVLFACASAVQQARHLGNAKNLDPQSFPQSRVVGARVLQDFQNETLLVVSFLRCLLSSELDEEAKIYVRDGLIEKISDAPDSPDKWALQELLLAQMRGLASRITDAARLSDIYQRAGYGAFLSP